MSVLIYIWLSAWAIDKNIVAGLSFEAGCRRNSTSTLYSAAGCFLCIKDKKCVIYSQSRYRDNDCGFFSLLIAYYRHDYWPLNCKQYKPNWQKSRRFSLANERLVPVYGMNKFYRLTKNQSTLTLFNQASQNVETKIEFPRSEFHRQMAYKRKEMYFWNIICSIIGWYKN